VASEMPNSQDIIERSDKLETMMAALSETVGRIIDAHMDEIALKIDQPQAKSCVVEAEEFILRDSKGRLGGCLCFLESGPALVLYDTNRRGGAVLCLENEVPALYLNSSTRPEKAVLKAGPDGSVLSLSDKEDFLVSIGSLNLITRPALEASGVPQSQQSSLAQLSQLRGCAASKWLMFSKAISKVCTTFST